MCCASGAARGEGGLRFRRVDAASLDAQRHARAEVELCARAAVEAAVGKVVWTRIAKVESRVAAEHVHAHAALVEWIQHEAGAADQRLDAGGADILRRLKQSFPFHRNERRKRVREPPAATALVGELECLVVSGEASEEAHF